MSNQKNGSSHSQWGKTSRFVYKNTAKRNPAITKEEKERFLAYGTLPKFKSTQRSEKWLQKKYPPVETDLQQEALTVLNKVRDQYGTGGGFIEAAYGKRISINRASEVIHNYLVEHGIDGMMSVHFSSELECSGKMQWTGPMTKYNQPEKRSFSMWVKTTNDNFYFRETGILNLSNHEIGTHFFRSVNDGLQPWFSNRPKFGLGAYKSQALRDTEEGLAALNTAFESKVKFIWGPAMLYYTACMSLEMNFKELFDHLSRFVADPEVRWKYVVRVKRGRAPSQLGGNGKDQCYFRGAVNILRNVDSINFLLLYSGKITVEDQPRIQRIARLGCIKTPYFLKDMNNYRRYMKNMLKVNGIPKNRTLFIKEPEIKINVPKTPRSKEDKFKRNQIEKKSPRTLLLEARQRIMSTQLLCKPRRRISGDTDSEEKIFTFSDQTLTIEHESDDQEDDDFVNYPQDGDRESTSQPRFGHASLTIVEREDNCIAKVPAEVFLSGRRRSDSFYSPRILSSPRKDDREQDSPDEDSSRSIQPGCANVFVIPNQTLEKFTKPQKLDEEDLFSAKITPEQVIVPSCASRMSTPSYYPPNGGLQLIRDIPSTPKPNMFEIRSSTIKNTSPRENMTPTLALRHGTPSPSPKIVRKGTPTSHVSSPSTPASKKSLKKNITTFFEELIPFSKSRRKRVLPLP